MAPATIPPSYIRVRAGLWECGDGQTGRQTDTQTRVTNRHFASATPHAKRNDHEFPSVLRDCWFGDSQDVRPVNKPVPLIPRGCLSQQEEGTRRGTG